MSLKIYNTLSGKKELFEPIEEMRVKIYVCGVTVYDECHVGHARAYITFDMIKSYFKHKGFRVTHVQNFTDIDDKIINKAREDIDSSGDTEGIDQKVRSITSFYTDRYFEFMDRMFIERADDYPRATEHVPEMISMIGKLIEKGLAYESGGDVYYAVKKFPGYGKLSHRKIEDLLAGARVKPGDKKMDALDFALWKKAKPNEPSWDSPWGKGRPGWHIECSAMSRKYLGETFDIHGGGQDLIFPHHENEIAQSEGCSGKQFVKYWVHNGFVRVDKEKMSKSLKNYFALADLLSEYPGELIRLFLLSSHYRSPVDFSHENMKAFGEQLKRGYDLLKNLDVAIALLENEACADEAVADNALLERTLSEFHEAMDDDFNTAGAIGVLFSFIKELNMVLEGAASAAQYAFYKKAKSLFVDLAGILKIFASPRIVVVSGIIYEDPNCAKIQKHLIARQEARGMKGWARADAIRNAFLRVFPGMDMEDRKNKKDPGAYFTVASFGLINEQMVIDLDAHLSEITSQT